MTKDTNDPQTEEKCWQRDELEMLGLPLMQLPKCNLELPAKVTVSRAPLIASRKFKTGELLLLDAILLFLDHRPGGKQGTSFSPFRFQNDKRAAANALSCQLGVIDCDRGDTLPEIIKACLQLGIAALVVSTHSHGSTTLEIKKAEWDRFQDKYPGGTAEQFLRQKQYRESVCTRAAVDGSPAKPNIKMIGSQPHIAIKHAPCAKYRIIVFATNPWERGTFSNREQAEKVYTDGLKQLAGRLNVVADPSCFDLARGYFLPRHVKGAEHEGVFVSGGTVDIWSGNNLPEGILSDPNNEPDSGASDTSLLTSKTLLPEVVEGAVRSIKNDGRFDWNDWFRVVAAIHNFFEGNVRGLDLATEFSEAWTQGDHKQEELNKVWANLSVEDGQVQVRVGTLLRFAVRDGWDSSRLSLTSDLGPHGDAWNGANFAEEHLNNLLYVEATGQWLQWSGIRWIATTRSGVTGLARACAQRLYRERKNSFVASGTEDARLLANAKSVSDRWERILKILEAAKSFPGMAVHGPGDFDLNPMYFGVENGVLDLQSGALLAPFPQQMISKVGRVAFDPNAVAPRFHEFLEQIMPDPEMRNFLQRAVGYTITGTVDEEVIFFMYGIGANGKSVFGNIIQALLGEYSVALGAALITKNKHENEAERLKARLPGTRLAQINEVAQGDIWDDQRMKELASREPISARYLHKEAFQFYPTHKLWVRGNHMPGAHDDGDGFWRRLIPIHFSQSIPIDQIVPDLDRQIIDQELSGILNWALEGCLLWQIHRLQIPDTVSEEKQAYRSETDVLGEWISECLELDPTSETPVSEAYRSYREFCIESGLKPASKNQLGRRMTAKGFPRSDNTSRRAYIGFRVRSHFDE